MDIVRAYFEALSAGHLEDILGLFEDEAMVHSPLYGDMRAGPFFTKLLADTQVSEVALLRTFNSADGTVAGQFHYNWTLSDGTRVEFTGVDVMELGERGKVVSLTILYDTYPIRAAFDHSRA